MKSPALLASARKLTIKNAVGLCVVGTGATRSAKVGTVMINIIQSANVCALCCNQHPLLMKNEGMVQDKRSNIPQYTEWSEIQLYVYAKFHKS